MNQYVIITCRRIEYFRELDVVVSLTCRNGIVACDINLSRLTESSISKLEIAPKSTGQIVGHDLPPSKIPLARHSAIVCNAKHKIIRM